MLNFKEITVNDLQPKHSRGESADNRIRKSWSLQMPDEVKAKFANFPGDVKRQLYISFDKEVNEIWTSMLSKANENAAKNNAKEIRVNGLRRLEDAYCVDPDEVLIQAAQIFIERFAEREAKQTA
ncbi:RNA polymerase binding protein [Acinetobacter phage vB_AbaM_PhT2]|uniref:RNA polymerase binding protein n=2 Tax=Hadassahvirus TaxID=2842716 RepID=A0A6B9SVZ0_9CAUD|nr:RNA polymerase binding [Acinetobacter phage AbTZA1]YP_009887248.1 RNA polymerase binding [Acinetobacter phage vB_AbaM_PhT2]QQM13838.1 RNA polymerase binding protein [Acinetobacter phage Maestro]QQM18594.1 RNA polymerase binding protein [Acinetobacter phage Morttis]QQO96301.1 RNA polymerase [Acinetobacter phage Minot]QQO96549.1 RNA polymerase binding protein [Acinetobacter phage Mokit]QQO96804.1 RNA polymerase binding protein [Acinetobacter phage Melin]UQS94177.1 RNA polymerase binding pro